MATYTLQQLALFKGVSYSSMKRYVSHLKANNRFKKKSVGAFYSESEAQTLSHELDFTLPAQNGSERAIKGQKRSPRATKGQQ